jgi:hypothetical protein
MWWTTTNQYKTMARGYNAREGNLGASSSASPGSLTEIEAAKELERLKPAGMVLKEGSFEDQKVNVDDPSTSKFITMDDIRRDILTPNQYGSVSDFLKPYAKQVLEMTKEDVRKVLADNTMKKVVMSELARTNGTNLVTRDKVGNWYGRVKQKDGGGRYWVAVSDYSAVSKVLLKYPEIAMEVFAFLKKK